MITLKNVTKVYTTKRGLKTTALKGVDLQFGDSGLVFILGKSGCGKSTLLNVLGGIDAPTSGEIVIDGVSSAAFTPADYDAYRNTYVGFVFQEYNLISDYTVSQNIALALELQNKKTNPDEIDGILKKVDLINEKGRTLGGRKVTELSGGQKQRVAIARALVKNPKIILADEPTGALDSKTGKELYELLKELSKDKLIVVVTHDRDGAFQYGDRIIELVDGKVVSDNGEEIAAPVEKKESPDFIRGRLPVKRAFAMGVNGLRHKVFRLILSIVLCVTTFIAFGFSVTALTTDPYSTQFDTMTANGLQLFSVKSYNTEYTKQSDGFGNVTAIPISERQKEAMRENLGNEPIELFAADGIYREKGGRLLYGIEPFLGADSARLEELKYSKPYYALATSGLETLVELDPSSGESDANLKVDSRFRTQSLCRLPQTDDEIALTDLQFELFKEFGYEDDDGSVMRIRTPDDLIGKKLGRFTVCGVYSTEVDASNFIKYKEMSSYDIDNNHITLNFYAAKSSVISFGFVCKGTYGDVEPDRYMMKYAGDTSAVKKMIKQMTYSDSNREYEAAIQTFYSVFLPDESFFNSVVDVALITSLVLTVFAVLLFMSFLSSSIEIRKKELGILRALGARKKDVVKICLFESLTIACINFVPSLIGVLIAVMNVNKEFLLTVFNVGFLQISALLIICFGVAALATILPVYKTVRRQPVDIIRKAH